MQSDTARQFEKVPLVETDHQNSIVNVSAYKFVELDDLNERRSELLAKCREWNLKGTILLSREGINVFVAGFRDEIDCLIKFLESRPEYRWLPIKESISKHQPFNRMLVRIKKEIIAFGVDGIRPYQHTSPKLSARQLKQWLDAGKPLTLLDVRNDYEVQLGTFAGAHPIGIDHFRNFPQAVSQLPENLKEQPVVMFCTGGIRCEKAGPYMEQQGFKNVYQLDGGILKYFEDVGGDHYEGECFVFDKRVAVDAGLNETPTEQCYACQHPLSIQDQQSEQYVPGESCPYCFISPQEQQRQRVEARNQMIASITNVLPGSRPYNNRRPMNVPLRFAGQSVIDFLASYHPHIDRQYWMDELRSGKLRYKHRNVSCDEEVWAGQRLVHLIEGTVEPDVNANIRVIYEDEQLVVVDKPAPLPMHPCGRFNRNSLAHILNAAFAGEKIRMAHRLDANTTGVAVFCRKRLAAQFVQTQFSSGNVNKVYLARVQGIPETEFDCTARISETPSTAGIRLIDQRGQEARTEFKSIKTFDDESTLLECIPRTGRTNQIRLHLWHLGFPILNDPIYLPGGKLGLQQTITVGQRPMCLHAWRVDLVHPASRQRMQFEAPRPDWCD
jgi:RluA family pseudouridine synthase